MSPTAPVKRSRLLALALLASVVAALAVAPAALADILSPESGGSPNADRIDLLYWIVFGMGFVVFLAVEGLLLYSIVKFRHRRGQPEAPQIHGSTRIEIGASVAATVLVVIISVITLAMLPAIRTPDQADRGGTTETMGVPFAATDQPPVGGRSVKIGVLGQQYIWRFEYPMKGVQSYYEMVAPTGIPVVLDITAQDVQHSWWIPKLGGKMDAVPGHVNKTWFKIPSGQEGRVFVGICAELCGENHAQMLAQVRAVSPAEFESWQARQAAALERAQRDLTAARQARERTEGRNAAEGEQTMGGVEQ